MVNAAVFMLALLPLVILAGRIHSSQDSKDDLLDDKFECVEGQGAAWGTYLETGDNSFEACGTLCLKDPECVAFDWNDDPDSGHLTLFNFSSWANAKLWVHDACRLFGDITPRLGKGMWGRQYCLKDADALDGHMVEPVIVPPETRNTAAVERAKEQNTEHRRQTAKDQAAWQHEIGVQVGPAQVTRNQAALERAYAAKLKQAQQTSPTEILEDAEAEKGTPWEMVMLELRDRINQAEDPLKAF